MEFPTWVEIDLDALDDNLAAIRKHTSGARILLVVKADAYGHGAVVVAREAMSAGVDMLGVATVHEGVELRRAGVMAPILVLSPCLTDEVDEVVRYGLRCTVASAPFLSALSAACARAGTTLPVHVEVDTGMGRSGVLPSDTQQLLALVDASAGVKLEGLFTHFPDAEVDPPRAERQVEEFTLLCAALETAGLPPGLRHTANSAGLLYMPGAALDMVRPGLLAYGVRPGSAPPSTPAVRPVMSFRSRLVQIRDLPAGASISYGRTHVTGGPTRIGVVAAGYGHGLGLAMSSRGSLLVGGRRVPILGRVTMDMTMVDLAEVPDARVEDEVVIFGDARGVGAGISIEETAAWCDTIPYEIMCSIGKRVPRVFRRGEATVEITTLIGDRRRRAVDTPTEAPIPAPALRRPMARL